MSFTYQTLESPVGTLYLVAKDGALHGVTFQNVWPTFKKRFKELKEVETPVLKQAKRELREYFAGKRQSFDLPLEYTGTDFQKRAWRALAAIPYGQTRTYKQQAKSIRSPKAVRAVGRTNGLNPFCIVLPCHRVVGSDGSLTGFAGGLKAKRFLLDLEGA